MTMVTDNFVSTALGRLHVQRRESGPAVVLWHSLFLDSRTWAPLIRVLNELAPQRTVITIDGPSHGKSDAVTRHFSYEECTQAAVQVLDGLGITEPVDWVGNAWGGHVGILLAAGHPQRIRTLTTIGTPVPGPDLRFRMTTGWPLVVLHRLFGPSRLCAPLGRNLMGKDSSEDVLDAFRHSERAGMNQAMRSMMLNRPDLHDRLPRITSPTLMLAAHDDDEGWPPDQARAACATMRNARAEVVSGGGRVSPLLVDADAVARTLVDFWADAAARPPRH